MNTSARVTDWYAILLIATLLWCPVFLGIPNGPRRVMWVILAIVCIICSWKVARSHTICAKKSVNTMHISWLLFVVVLALAVGVSGVFPVTFFGDEDTIALLANTLVHHLVAHAGWIGLNSLLFGSTALLFVYRNRLRKWHVWFVIFVSGAITLLTAATSTQTIGLMVRYPPIVHLAQTIATILSFGELSFLRVVNVGWTVLLGFVCWYGFPRWTWLSRLLLLITICSTPLGWSYRILLYQSCGELTLGLLVLSFFYVSKSTLKQDQQYAAMLGMILSVWILLRPTAIIFIGISALVFLFKNEWRSAITIVGISGPIGLLWACVYVFGSFQYPFLNSSSQRSFPVIEPLRQAALHLPEQLTWPIIFIVTSVIAVVWYKRAEYRFLIGISWLFGISNTVLHQLLTLPQWYGYGRFSALLMIPVGITIACGAQALRGHRLQLVYACLCVLILWWSTPWNIVKFLQDNRQYQLLISMENSVTGGVIPTPLPIVLRQYMKHKDSFIILSPNYSFLDFYIANGALSVSDRNDILHRSKQWKLGDPNRPVLIQSPTSASTYRPNITEEEERRLREAARWALKEPTLRVEVYGNEKTLIVE